MDTIKIYWVVCHSGMMRGETGDRWQYEPWKGDHLSITGETLETVEVKIPEGMTYGKNNLDMPGLFDRSGFCDLGGNQKHPLVYASTGVIGLKTVKASRDGQKK